MVNDFWRQVLSSGLIGAGGGNPMQAFLLQQQQRDKEAQRSALAPLATAFAPQQFPSPTGPGNPQPTMGSVGPNMAQVAPLLARAAASGVDIAPFISLASSLQPPKPSGPLVTKPGDILRDPNNPQAILAQNPAAQAEPAPFNLSPGQTRFGPDGRPIVSLPAAPDGGGAPQTRTRIEGDKEVVEQFNAASQKWDKVSEGPRWAPNRSDEGGPGITDQGVLRREFNTEAGPFETVATATVRALEAAKDPSAAGDLALIFNFMKILDPGSVVREAEFATAQNAAGVPERIRAQYNQVVNGERLSDTTRKDFVDRAKRLYRGQADQFGTKILGRYKGLAKQYGIPEANIIQDYRIDLKQYESPSPGAARMGGFKYLGTE